MDFSSLVWLKWLESLYKYKEQKQIAPWWQLILSGRKSCLAAWFHYLSRLAKKRCQPSPGATLGNKVVSNRGQNQSSLAPSTPLLSLALRFQKESWTLILASQSRDTPPPSPSCLMPPLAVHLWAVKTLQLHIVRGCQCNDDKGF